MQQCLRDLQCKKIFGPVGFLVDRIVRVGSSASGQNAGGLGDAWVVVGQRRDNLSNLLELRLVDCRFDVLTGPDAHPNHNQRRIVVTGVLADRAADALHDLDLAAARLPEEDCVQNRYVNTLRQAPCVRYEVETIVAILR
ncbi:Uncharacterised protein [Mycobacteroides abscessus subsp. abscessus]|nr:Uncharacterised protein [Mycobacteroides abscessus subsp. abscessus]SIF86219.1 Uncharacterised protein [Mycobacteroides abscessus subsp. abscessus]SIM71159.1 Uncharacterised protein [Mycobacteroides abscessus subsp. abscessus]